MHSKRIVLYLVCFDGCSKGVTWLVRKSLDAACALVLTGPVGRLCILNVTIKDKSLSLIGGLCAQ